jgi:putative acetyltransferase
VSAACFTIRAGVPEDGAALLSVHRRSILTLGRACYTEKEIRSWAAKLVAEGYGRAMTEGGETFEVALDPLGRVIAFCSRKDEEVMGLYVDPDWARQGVGTALLARAEAAIETAGHSRVLIGASLTGQAFYEVNGYRMFERRIWKTRGGLEIAVLAMEKVFP